VCAQETGSWQRAIGYVRVGNDSIAKDPDRRIAQAITLVFAKFTDMQSVRQVHLWLRHERIPLRANDRETSES
jgi:hypothetical protein